jgi:6-pyruvoyl-tetrahydropterin synthase
LTSSFDKTLINSKTGFSKQDLSLAINMKRLAQTAEVKQQNLNKNQEESLRHSIKKVYVSQLDESEVSGP